jgi:hypothetical protein
MSGWMQLQDERTGGSGAFEEKSVWQSICLNLLDDKVFGQCLTQIDLSSLINLL